MSAQEIEKHMMEWVRSCQGSLATAGETPVNAGMDSLDAVELVVHLEEKIDHDIPDEWIVDGLEKKTFRELSELLAKKLEE